MFGSISLTLTSFVIIVVLFSIYIFQKRNNTLQSKIYLYLLMIEAITMFCEILFVIFAILDINSVANIFNQIAWNTILIVIAFFNLYFGCLTNNKTYNNLEDLLKENKYILVSLIILGVLFVIGIFIPMETYTQDNYSYFAGTKGYYNCLFEMVALIEVLVYFAKNKNNPESKRNKLLYWSMVGFFIFVFIIETAETDVDIKQFAITIFIFVFYFFMENPDIKAAKELEIVNDKIDKSLSAKDKFLFEMSNEILEPNNDIIRESYELVNSKKVDDHFKAGIKDIENKGNSLLNGINNMLDILILSSSDKLLEEKEYSITDIIVEIKKLVSYKFNNIKLIFEVNPKLPNILYGDYNKIFQIIYNLILLSLRQTDAGKIKVKITYEVINENMIKLIIKVSDTGKGYLPNELEELRNKVNMISIDSNETYELNNNIVIVKKYIDALNGNIDIVSEKGIGTNVTLTFNQKVKEFNELGNVNENANLISNFIYKDYTGKKVLVVDDDEKNVIITRKILEAYHLNVTYIATGNECIYNIKSGNEYDLILLDPNLTGVSGKEVVSALKNLRSVGGYKVPSIIALTASAVIGSRDIYLDEGFDDYLSKPIDLYKLDNILKNNLGK